MEIENKLVKKLYRRMVLWNLIFGSKSSIMILVLYVLLWRVLYTITKIGQLKANVPLFLGIILLLLAIFIYIFIGYRKRMKKDFIFQHDSRIDINETELVIVSSNSTDRHVFPLDHLTKIKENKNWYFLYFEDKTLIPISKETVQSREQLSEYIKGTFGPTLWKWTAISLLLITLVGGYYVGSNAINFNGALAWKINELKTDTKIKLQNDNFYKTKLVGIMNSVKEKLEMEPYLITNDLEIEFEKDGTITSIYTYIYGFDQNQKLQSGYLIYFDKTKSNKVTVHKQDWDGEGTMVYDPNNDLSIVANMLTAIPIEDEVKRWNEDSAVLYKGIRSWGYNLEGIRFIDEDGKITIPSMASTEINDPTVSLYIPGKENIITPGRYVFKP